MIRKLWIILCAWFDIVEILGNLEGKNKWVWASSTYDWYSYFALKAMLFKIPFVHACISLVLIISNRTLLHSCLTLPDNFITLNNKYGDHRIRYQYQAQLKLSPQNQFFSYFAPIDNLLNGNKKVKPAIICIHGFGGNADQFRKNLPVFSANGYDSYAIDLLGYGYR